MPTEYLQHLICFIEHQDLDARSIQHALAKPVSELAMSTNDDLLLDLLISAGRVLSDTTLFYCITWDVATGDLRVHLLPSESILAVDVAWIWVCLLIFCSTSRF